jgi:hypothetical protein
MNKKKYLNFLVLPALVACGGGEAPTKFVFDVAEMRDNTKAYVLSNGPMDEFGCAMQSLLFTKEVLQSVASGKDPDIANAENFSPTTINVFENEIEWVDLGQKTPIENNSVKLTGPDAKSFSLTVVRENGNLAFIAKDKKMECKIPFKKAG